MKVKSQTAYLIPMENDPKGFRKGAPFFLPQVSQAQKPVVGGGEWKGNGALRNRSGTACDRISDRVEQILVYARFTRKITLNALLACKTLPIS